MYNHQHFNKVLRDLIDTTRFGKPTTFDAETKKCNLFSIIFLIYTNVSYFHDYINADSDVNQTSKVLLHANFEQLYNTH
nr:unnamed protein product [Callosobruchus chinensis]